MKGIVVQVILLISERAPASNRLKSLVQDTMNIYPSIQYVRLDSMGQVVPTAFEAVAIAIVMVAKKEELAFLARRRSILERFKIILVLPDDERETMRMAHSLRPIYITYMDSSFGDVAAILAHNRNRLNMDLQTRTTLSTFQYSQGCTHE